MIDLIKSIINIISSFLKIKEVNAKHDLYIKKEDEIKTLIDKIKELRLKSDSGSHLLADQLVIELESKRNRKKKNENT